METVKQFENELNGIQDTRPPVSRAKMASITKLAMKAVKYYKHIVMLVEKFISKSNPEYKVPGLYVIDSIMRQSRHQFGADKDCFGPRFTKNIEKTFLHIFQCPDEDKPKCVRVLNLWQKNEVFSPDVIQPLLVLASDHAPLQRSTKKPEPHKAGVKRHRGTLERHGDRMERHGDKMERHGDGNERHGDRMEQHEDAMEQCGDRMEPHRDRMELHEDHPPFAHAITSESNPGVNSNLDLGTATTIIQQQQEQITALLQQQQQLQSQATSLLAPALQNVITQQQGTGGIQQLETLSALLQQTQQLHQLQTIQQRLSNGEGGDNERGGGGGGGGGLAPAQISNIEHAGHSDQPPVFNKALLDDFDYSDEEDDVDMRLARQRERLNQQQTRLQDSQSPGVVHSSTLILEKLQTQFRQQELASASVKLVDSGPPRPPLPSLAPAGATHLRERNEPLPFSDRMSHPPPPPSSASFSSLPPPSLLSSFPPPPPISHTHIHSVGPPPGPPQSRDWPRPPPPLPPHFPPPPRSPSPRMRRDRFSPPPLRGRSPSPPPPHRMWRERSRWSPRRRSRSPPPIHRRRSRDRSRSPPPPPPSRWKRMSPPPPEEGERRRKKGHLIPEDKHLTVCSTTIWVGHLPKMTQPDLVKQAFEDFGQVKSVELVQARGCAYVVMVHRSDAGRVQQSLRDLKIGGAHCKLAWAPGRGVKGASLKEYWDQEIGTSFIPWSLVKTQGVINTMAEGGWVDPRSCPPHLAAPPITTDDQQGKEASVPPLNPAPHAPPIQLQPPVAPPTSSATLPAAANPPLPTSNMNPFPQPLTPSFQPPGNMPQFPPRGPPHSQPMSMFSQPNMAPQNGGPFHGEIAPPMGRDMRPNLGLRPQQMVPGPPMGGRILSRGPLLGMEPHPMAHSMGGRPQNNRPPMSGGPQHGRPPMPGGPQFRPPMTGGPQFSGPPMSGGTHYSNHPMGGRPQFSMAHMSRGAHLNLPHMAGGQPHMPPQMHGGPHGMAGLPPPHLPPSLGHMMQPHPLPPARSTAQHFGPPIRQDQEHDNPVYPPEPAVSVGEGPSSRPPPIGEGPPAMPPRMVEGPPVMPPPMNERPPSMPPRMREGPPVMLPLMGDRPPVMPPPIGEGPPVMPPLMGGRPPAVPALMKFPLGEESQSTALPMDIDPIASGDEMPTLAEGPPDLVVPVYPPVALTVPSPARGTSPGLPPRNGGLPVVPPPMDEGPLEISPPMDEGPPNIPTPVGEGPQDVPPPLMGKDLPNVPPPIGKEPSAVPPPVGVVPLAVPPPMGGELSPASGSLNPPITGNEGQPQNPSSIAPLDHHTHQTEPQPHSKPSQTNEQSTGAAPTSHPSRVQLHPVTSEDMQITESPDNGELGPK